MSDPTAALRAISGAEPSDTAVGLPNIPAVPFTDDASLTNFLQSAKLWMEKAMGAGLTGFATKQDLIRNGLLGTDAKGNLVPTGGVPNLAIPPVPTGLQANGAMTNILLEWDNPFQAYGNHGYTEIWAAETNNFSGAVMVGESGGFTFAHAVNEDATRYYWIRFVSTSGIKGPYNSVNGTMGQTARNPAYLLDTLTGQLTESQLYADLNSRIDLIDGAEALTGSVNARIKATNDALQAQINDLTNTPAYDNAVTYTTGDIVQYSGGLYRAKSTTTGNLPTNTTYWTKIGDYTSLGAAVADNTAQIAAINTVTSGSSSAAAQAIVGLQSRVTTAEGNITSNATAISNTYTKAQTDSAISSASSTLTAAYQSADTATLGAAQTYADSAATGALNTAKSYADAGISSESTARASADSALTTQVNTAYAAAAKTRTYSQNTAPTSGMVEGDLWFDANDGYKAYRYTGTQWSPTDDTRIAGNVAAIESEATTRADETSALATSINILSATVEDNNTTLSAAIDSEATTRADEDAVLAELITAISSRLDTGGDVANAIVQTQATANTAVTNAEAAQGTADSKVRTYAQAEEPTADLVTGDLWIDTDDNNRLYRWNGSSWVDAADVRITTTASLVTDIQTTVNDHTTSIQTNAESIDGIQGKYTVKIDNNGYVTGYGLISEDNNGTPTSEFMVVADKFSIAQVASNSNADSPFFHLTSPTTINGVEVPAGTYMKAAFIADASITNAKVASLSADKLTSGYILADRIAASSVTADKIDSRGLSIKDASGNVILSAGSALRSDLAPQANANLVRGLKAWTLGGTLSLVNTSIAADGIFLSIPNGQNFISASSPYMNLQYHGTTFTVSFKAWSSVAGRDLIVDLFPDTLPDSGGIALTTTPTVITRTWTSSHADMANCCLRFFAGSQPGDIGICDIKLEIGSTKSAWVANALDVSNSSVGTGGNQLSNSLITNDSTGWTNYCSKTLANFGVNLPGNNGCPVPYYALNLSYSGATDTDYSSSIHTATPSGAQFIPVIPGQRVEAQAMVEVFRGNARLEINFVDINGNNVGGFNQVTGGVGSVNGDTAWGKTAADFVKLWGFATAPVGAVKAYIEIRTKRTSTAADTVLYVAMPYLGYATQYQVDATPWSPGSPTSTRILGYTGTLDANTTYVDGSGNIQGVASGAGTQVDNSRAIIGQNLIPNSNMITLTAVNGWNPNTSNVTAFDLSKNVFGTSSPYCFYGVSNSIAIQQTGIVSGGDYAVGRDIGISGSSVYSQLIPVVQGQKYCFSAYVACHRCYAEVRIAWYDSNGTWLAETGWPGTLTTSKTDTTTNVLTGFLRQFVIATPPANAVKCYLFVRKYNTIAGYADSWTWVLMPQFEAIGANASEPSPYTPGPAIGALSTIDKIIAANASTYIADAAIGNAQIADAAITSAKIGDAAITYAKIGEAEINTLSIANNAVTIPVAATGISSATTISADFAGQNVVITAFCGGELKDPGLSYLRIYRDTTLIATYSFGFGDFYPSYCAVFLDKPSSGNHYYQVTATGPVVWKACGITALGVKR